MNYIVVLFDSIGMMFEPDVILFDDFHDPIPYIKDKLKSWDIYDTNYQKDLEKVTTVEDAQCLVDEYHVSTIKICRVSQFNPEA